MEGGRGEEGGEGRGRGKGERRGGGGGKWGGGEGRVDGRGWMGGRGWNMDCTCGMQTLACLQADDGNTVTKWNDSYDSVENLLLPTTALVAATFTLYKHTCSSNECSA